MIVFGWVKLKKQYGLAYSIIQKWSF